MSGKLVFGFSKYCRDANKYTHIQTLSMNDNQVEIEKKTTRVGGIRRMTFKNPTKQLMHVMKNKQTSCQDEMDTRIHVHDILVAHA